jgi:hypothetical protein
MLTKRTVFCSIVIFSIIWSTICPQLIANNENYTQSPDDSFIKDIEITSVDFPKVVQKWKSKFNVNVTVHKHGIFPLFLKATVFIRDCEKCFGILKPIGKIIVPTYKTDSVMNISIPCETHSNKVKNWLKKEALWSNKSWLNGFLEQGDIVTDGEIFVWVRGAFKSKCEREFITITNPITCTEAIEIKWFQMDKVTDENGKFTVSFNISSLIDHDLRLSVLVDVADKPIFNSILPNFLKMSSTIYNLGHMDEIIPNNGNINGTINCSFPENWYCHEEYDVTVEFAPYIDIGNSSSLGEEFYDGRFKEKILPKYDVNSTVLKSIRRMWYNTPIFLYDAETLFPVKHESILFNGTSLVEEILEEVKEKAEPFIDDIKEFAFFCVMCIIAFLIIYVLIRGAIDWVVRKKP